MKLKMLEHFQGSGVPTLEEGKEYVVGKEIDSGLAEYLLLHRKAVEIGESSYYGAQPFKGDDKSPLREDDKLSEKVKKVSNLGEEVEVLNENDLKILEEFAKENAPNLVEKVEKKEIDATPAAIKKARKEKVDLSEVEGTGSGGRVTLPDVEGFLEKRKQ